MKAIFITCRTGSSRLPNKALLEINGLPTIQYVINNALKSSLAEKIILCTTTLPEDDILQEIAEKNNINYFRGSTYDKLDRWNQACNKFGIDFFVTADGDDLFCSPQLMDLAFAQYEEEAVDLIKSSFVVPGLFTYGVNAVSLNTICKEKTSSDTEMMWVFFEKSSCSITELKGFSEMHCLPNIRVTLDYKEDLDFFRKVFEDLGPDPSTTLILDYLKNNPDVSSINFFREKEWKLNQNQAIIKSHEER